MGSLRIAACATDAGLVAAGAPVLPTSPSVAASAHRPATPPVTRLRSPSMTLTPSLRRWSALRSFPCDLRRRSREQRLGTIGQFRDDLCGRLHATDVAYRLPRVAGHRIDPPLDFL